jgi:hypothetical protein
MRTPWQEVDLWNRSIERCAHDDSGQLRCNLLHI